MAREPVSTQIGNTKDRPLLRFDVARKALEQRLATYRGTERVPVTAEEGSLNLSSIFRAEEVAAIVQNRTARAALNRVMQNAGKRLQDHARKVSRQTYETGAFYSNWKVAVKADSSGLKSVIELTNAVPYALYVHPKGTPIEDTVFNKLIKPWIQNTLKEQLIEDILRALPKAVKSEVVGGAR